MEVLLTESNLCRLCAADNSSGSPIFVAEDGVNLSDLINSYLPLKVVDDGKYPRTICPGCAIQLEATVEFFNLIIKGQQVLRDVLQHEKENQQKLFCELSTENGLFPEDHSMALQTAGLDKPKRKRGRPKKIPKQDEEVKLPVTAIKSKFEETPPGKRKRKTPERYREAVQGKELERMFKEEGVIGEDESDNESKKNPLSPSPLDTEPAQDEVIGHMQTEDGLPAGEPIMIAKGKSRGRPKGPSRSKIQQCGICGLELSCLGRYMSHIAQHGKVLYQCAQCSETFHNRLLFNEHQQKESHTGQNIIKCEQDEQENKTESDNKNDNQIVEPMVIAPENTETEATSDPLAKQEISEEIQVNTSFEIDNTQEFGSTDIQDPATDATTVLETTEFFIKDIIESEKDNKTVDADGQPNAEPALEEDEAINKLKCPHCNKIFSTKQSKSLHIKAKHRGEKPYVCKECGQSFPYPRSLSLHMAMHRKVEHSGYACDLCGKILNHPSSVVYHKEAEHTGKKFKCIKCGKVFKHKQLLQRHQLVHSQARPYACKLCSASFKTKANLINHQPLHSGIKKYSCETCNQSFAHKTSLTLHMRWHSGQKPFECDMCHKKFTQRGNLLEHRRTHTGEKPYACSLCPRAFTTSSQFRLHTRRHTGEKPFACTHCGKRFVSTEAWRAHMRRELGQLEHWCNVCGRGFAERWAMLKHQRCHSGEKPFHCPHCPRAFADCSNLTKHKKIHKAANSLLVQDKKDQGSIVAATAAPPEPEEGEEEKVIYVTYSVDGGTDAPTFHILDAEQAAGLDGSKVITATCDLYDGNSLLVDDEQIQLTSEMDDVSGRIDDAILEELQPMEARIYIEDQEEENPIMEQQHMSVTDEEGNPIQFTMQDGTTIEITSADGKSLQVLTQDGQSIPVELSSYKEGEMESDVALECVEIEGGEVMEGGEEMEGGEMAMGGEGEGEEQVRLLTLDDSTLAHFFTIG